MKQGTVKWFNDNKGYGFIDGPNAELVFVHFSAIEKTGEGVQFLTLREGETVQYETLEGPKGPQAVKVIREGK